jgi:hypothetical protein|tara:strand:- start:2395 stop:2511 length:117 start_codon:yes stop_codon:yes gene_type:complete
LTWNLLKYDVVFSVDCERFLALRFPMVRKLPGRYRGAL